MQAAAYGLPVVATKNGGPVDILKVEFLTCKKHVYLEFYYTISHKYALQNFLCTAVKYSNDSTFLSTNKVH